MNYHDITSINEMGVEASCYGIGSITAPSSWEIPKCDKRSVLEKYRSMVWDDFVTWGSVAYDATRENFIKRFQKLAGFKIVKKKIFLVDGVYYLSLADAAADLNVSNVTISHMCKGYTSQGKQYPAKPGCEVKIIDRKLRY